jgi:hypothetical protein
MTRGEFITQFDLLCKGFRLEPTKEQGDAWFRKVQQYAMEDWAEAVSTLLCAPRFPLLDPVLAALDAAREHRKRIELWKDRKAAERVIDGLESGQDSALSPELFQTVKVFLARQQVRRYQMQVAANFGDRWAPARREAELTRLQQEEQRLTREYQQLMGTLSQADCDAFVLRYQGHEVAA